MDNRVNQNNIAVYTDANPEIVCIAIEKTERQTGKERRFELIVIEQKFNEFFEANAVRIALTYVPENCNILLYCDKEGDVVAIQKGKSKNSNLQTIIEKIKELEIERNLSVEYRSIPRKQNFSGRILDKIY